MSSVFHYVFGSREKRKLCSEVGSMQAIISCNTSITVWMYKSDSSKYTSCDDFYERLFLSQRSRNIFKYLFSYMGLLFLGLLMNIEAM